jgi:type II secretory pathway pseudopilin PulG
MKIGPGRGAPVASPQRRRRTCGFSLFELAVAAVVFSLVVGILLQRLAFYQDEAERAGVQLQLANMRTALHHKALQAALHSNPESMAALSGANPVAWLERAPVNYRGEIDDEKVSELMPGNWYFDRARRNLVYVFTSKKSFPVDSYERRYFKVEFAGLPTNNAKPDGSHGQYGGVALIQVDGK